MSACHSWKKRIRQYTPFLLNDTAQKKGVVYASVLDHRNKVVAFTGIGQLVPNMTETKRSIEQVLIWEGGFTSHAKILNFASDVNYAGTKIGEILIGLSTSETADPKNQYLIIAVTSFLVLLLLFMFHPNIIFTHLSRLVSCLCSCHVASRKSVTPTVIDESATLNAGQ